MAANEGLLTTKCGFCGVSESQAGRLVAGRRVVICDTCVAFAGQVIDDPSSRPDARTATLACSFCDRPAHHAQGLVRGPGVRICDHCVRYCDRVLAAD